MSAILVTGGAGAIGSQLTRLLVRRGHQVTVVDDCSSGARENVPARARIVEADISGPGVLEALFGGGGFEYVFHLAALFANQNSVDHPERDLEVNAMGTLRLA